MTDTKGENVKRQISALAQLFRGGINIRKLSIELGAWNDQNFQNFGDPHGVLKALSEAFHVQGEVTVTDSDFEAHGWYSF